MKRIIIIGAGPAGLTAGLTLLRQTDQYEVVILEETDAIGGISRTVNHNGNRMDIGGHRFFSKDERINAWWQALMPTQGKPAYDDIRLGRSVACESGGPDPEREDAVMLRRSRVSRIYYRRKFFDYPVKMNANTLKNMGFATTCAAGFSYLSAALFKKKETSLEDFYINRFGKKLYSMFFEGYTEKLWGRHPSKISADWGAQRVKGLSIRTILKDIVEKLLPNRKSRRVETSLIEEFSYPKYGPGQLWERVAAEFERLGGKIQKSCRVERVLLEGQRVVSVTCKGEGGEVMIDADAVISSMPIQDLVAGMNSVPEDIARIAKGLPYRDFVTVGLLLRRLSLKNETKLRALSNIVPDCWIYVQDPSVRLGRIQIFNNWSCYMVKDPEKTVFIGLEYFCREGDAYWNMSDAEWTDFAVSELRSMGVIDKDEPVLDSHCERVKKAYPAYFDTYAEMPALTAWLNGIENLYCVGRNGQHRYNNMDHSMATAFEAVKNLLGGAKDKSNIWSVNTEQEYHEEKA